MLDVPEFKKAWLDYCELYNAGPEIQKERLGSSLGAMGLPQGHSRLTAYAAKQKGDAALAKRAWEEFSRNGRGRQDTLAPLPVQTIKGPAVLRPVDEARGVSTNDTAQWGLAAIECLAFVGDSQPAG